MLFIGPPVRAAVGTEDADLHCKGGSRMKIVISIVIAMAFLLAAAIATHFSTA
jgi:hypothetical protein